MASGWPASRVARAVTCAGVSVGCSAARPARLTHAQRDRIAMTRPGWARSWMTAARRPREGLVREREVGGESSAAADTKRPTSAGLRVQRFDRQRSTRPALALLFWASNSHAGRGCLGRGDAQSGSSARALPDPAPKLGLPAACTCPPLPPPSLSSNPANARPRSLGLLPAAARPAASMMSGRLSSAHCVPSLETRDQALASTCMHPPLPRSPAHAAPDERPSFSPQPPATLDLLHQPHRSSAL
ncbi:hypothetical protein B0J12DRAFT_777703 [Macrophomina phaseolina]|uniref:Uncharacterized protein n=1 Tax=Macrophomina phaseolina TaxID=35725 RepID=A0ABQ8GF17_9PEZI|nr:hypothetical protein B0J12DRAFT_777703 [Macrophomina phaseolina]